MKVKKLAIKKIQAPKEKLDVKGQSCWDDCKVGKNNTSTPKCAYEKNCYVSCFLQNLEVDYDEREQRNQIRR